MDIDSVGVLLPITALMLLGPGTPMLFRGQEFGASAPFVYLADHKPELARLVRRVGLVSGRGASTARCSPSRHSCSATFEDDESWHLPGESAIVMRKREGETDG
jgi:1,4-alpha-glucan branching enzyme